MQPGIEKNPKVAHQGDLGRNQHLVDLPMSQSNLKKREKSTELAMSIANKPIVTQKLLTNSSTSTYPVGLSKSSKRFTSVR